MLSKSIFNDIETDEFDLLMKMHLNFFQKCFGNRKWISCDKKIEIILMEKIF